MKPHFPTVPIETALRYSVFPPPESFRPLVMVVDDERMITHTLSAILSAKGFAVLTAQDAEEALDACAVMPPELLITDVSMPGKNGFDLAIEVKEIAADCEVIFFSGHQALAEMCAEMGEMGGECVFLVKPVHPAELLDRVFEVLRRRGHAVQPESRACSRNLYEFMSSVVRGGEGNGSSRSPIFQDRERVRESLA